ncbi:unnamed protein product [Closterium sp. NIES-53]
MRKNTVPAFDCTTHMSLPPHHLSPHPIPAALVLQNVTDSLVPTVPAISAMAAESGTTFLPGPLPVDTSHILQCPTSALPFLQKLRAPRAWIFLFHVLPKTPFDDAQRRLEAAWAEDPDTALRLVMQLRAVRGAGKGDRFRFFHCVTWLYKNHPRTLLQNLWLVPEFGSFKDLLEIVRIALEVHGRKRKKRSGKRITDGEETSRAELVAEEWLDSDENDAMAWNNMVKKSSWEGSRSTLVIGKGKQEVQEEEEVAENRRQMDERELRAVLRKERRARRAAEVAHAYESSERLRAVHNAVAAIFAAALKGDLETMRAFEERRARKNAEGEGAMAEEAMKEDENEKAGEVGVENAEAEGEGGKEEEEEKGREGEKKKRKWMGRPAPRLSLAAKWAPSPGKSYDQSTLLTSSIALLLFPPSSSSSSPSPSLSSAAAGSGTTILPEGGSRQRCGRRGSSSSRRGGRVPASGKGEAAEGGAGAAAESAGGAREYLQDVKGGEALEDVETGTEAKIAAGALLPHELVKAAEKAEEQGDGNDSVIELQWKAMVADVRSKGSLGSSMAVCDVSGSMYRYDMAIALSLLVSEVSSEPWKNHLITFARAREPMIHRVQGETLAERVRSTEAMDWAYDKTNFQAVFDLLLSRTQQFQLDPPDMVQRLYVFCDMQFNKVGSARSAKWETDHQAIKRKYAAAGYPVPQIVYWNLKGNPRVSSTPALVIDDEVALVSGFSKGILQAVLEGKQLSPLQVLDEAIGGELFDLLRVVD